MKYIKPLAICLIVLALGGYYHRQPTEDDAWFAEESYWLLKTGYVKSEFFRGFLNWDIHYFLSHKLFIVVGAGLQYLLPLSPYMSKLLGLLFFGVLICLLLFYQQQNHKKIAIWLLLTLVFSDVLLVKMSFENRPELMVTTLGFGSFLLIYKNPSLSKSALAGLLAALALLSHLNGIIYILSGFALLLYYKEHRNLLVFSAVSLIVSSLYFYDIWQFNGLDSWWYQFSNDPATRDSLGGINKLKIMLSYPKIFFESPEQASLSLLVLVLGWHSRVYFSGLRRSLIVYSLVLVVSFWLFTKSVTAIYQVLFIPTFFVWCLELYALLVKNKQSNKVIYVMALLYVCVGIVGSVQIIAQNNSNYLPTQFASLRPNITTPKQVGLVPLTFFFNEYPHFDRLLCQTNFELQMKYKDKTPTQILFFDWAKQNKADFVVLDYLNNNADYYPNKSTTTVQSYRRIYSDSQFAVYQAYKNP